MNTAESLLQNSCRIALNSLLQEIRWFATQAKATIPDFIQNKAIYLDNELLKIANQLATGLVKANPSQKMQHFTLFEQIHIDEKQKRQERKKAYCYPFAPLSADSIFPVPITTAHQGNYTALWQAFETALTQIPPTHQQNLPLWLDHFDSCLQTYTHNIPSASTAGVSLYDHAKTVTAIATALWRYQQTNPNAQLDNANNNPFLLIQADFFGIQNFIFAHGGDSTKKAAKLLRGRSFYVSLITECAALKVLEALQLPSTSQIINAAGKFLIVAPNTDDTKDKLKALQQEFNAWFLQQSYGQSGLGLAWQEACCNDFIAKGENAGFKALMKKLHEKLERSKYQHFDLCGENPAKPVFSDYLDSFNNELGVCQLNDKAPAVNKNKVSTLAQDQINIGTWLIKHQRLVITLNSISDKSLKIPLFGYHIYFTAEEDRSGKFSAEVKSGNIRRVFDFSPAKTGSPLKDCQFCEPLWNGYARRNISGYVPYFEDANEWISDKYIKFLNPEDLDDTNEYQPKTLNHLALEDLQQENGNWYGIKALAVLKGDIDNLGAIFQNGLEQPTFAKMAALSRQVNNFFAVYLPYLCQSESKYQNTYIVFAGGDDFFLLGSWQQLMELANKLRKEFQRYVVNEQIHFSAGLTVMKPKIPIYQLAEIAEEALEQSKQYPGKNAVTCFKQTVSWDKFEKLTTEYYQRLEDLREEYQLSTAYIYSLLRLSEMAAEADIKPESNLWNSQLYYRTYRTIANKKGMEKEDKKRACNQLINDIGVQGIREFKNAYQITLHAHLYKHRKQA